uniref:F-box domain-containing protein n=1 Tax=Oryza punctata TaxID=4537 RepID=A0A0E0LMS8_ORYPU
MAGIDISTSEQDEDSQVAEIIGSELALPEDIQYHIHALLPMRDAARAACLSCGFLSSWRFYPKLIFNTRTLGINEDRSKRDIET